MSITFLIPSYNSTKSIEETVKETLPNDFQTAEYLKSHGMIDLVLTRSEQKNKMCSLLKSLMFYKN